MNARASAAACVNTAALLDKAESFIRGESLLTVIVDEPVELICSRLEHAAVLTGHEIVARHDLGATLRAGDTKAAGLWPQLHVYELSGPGLLAQLLRADLALAQVLPCRVVVHDGDVVTTVLTPRPTVAWPEFSHAPEVMRLARQAEHGLQRLLQGLQ